MLSEKSASEQLREDLLRLSGEHWEAARMTASQALCTLALGIEGASAPRSTTKTLREQARLLSDPEQVPFTQSDRVRDGLEAAVTALENLAAARKLKTVGSWLSSARSAVAQVDRDDLFELQRAAIQDAFRTVSVAFVMVTGGSPPAAPSAPEEIAPPTVRLSGTLIRIEQRPRASGAQVTYAWVQTGESEVLVELAPAPFLQRNPLPARPGDEVQISGITTAQGAVISMVAFSVEGPRGPPLQLRDERGLGRWSRPVPGV
ncbi:MAG: hypothetical protein Q8N23_07970 [Archangium sp.]|nr:hypothetical protein [Archangium sp.]MDP3571009.1 hypothetical protein [Archangium sp.]